MYTEILLRSITSLLIVALLLVPSLVRAQQRLDVGRTASAVSSFTKSVDVPPDAVNVTPDVAVTLIDIEAVLHPVRGFVVAPEQTLPDTPDLLDTDTLRGPPAPSLG
ncbi:MAG TPA: hypothetical protein VFA59_03985 [Vicinamibacterales bacterium]|nr:hypothetical protein [Vicinamibacterales bacterium]